MCTLRHKQYGIKFDSAGAPPQTPLGFGAALARLHASKGKEGKGDGRRSEAREEGKTSLGEEKGGTVAQSTLTHKHKKT